MQFMIIRQAADRQLCLTGIVTDLLILLMGCFKLKSFCISQHLATILLTAVISQVFFQVGSWEGELLEDGLEIHKGLGSHSEAHLLLLVYTDCKGE